MPAALERCRLLGARRIVVLPYFLFTGVLPDRVVTQTAAWAAAHPGLDVQVAAVMGDGRARRAGAGALPGGAGRAISG